MLRRAWFRAAVLTVGTVLLVAAGLAYPGAAAEAPKGGTLRVEATDIALLDPALASGDLSYELLFATCATLFNYPDQSGAAGTRVMEEVVRNTSVSRDRRVYTFDLKRSFRFSTGAPVTARSFEAAFNRVANPRLKSYAAGYMREIVGAAAVMDGNAQRISGVRVLAPYRLQVRLTRPIADFTARLTMPFFCPIPTNAPVDPAGMNEPPGSGPYYVADRVPNHRIVLKRNPYYGGGRPAHVNQIVVTTGDSGEHCLRAVEQDRIDYCSVFLVPTAEYPRLADNYGVNRQGGQFFVEPQLQTSYVAFNHEREAFEGPGQIPLKQAINYAIDRPEFARRFNLYPAPKRTDQMLPPPYRRDETIYPLSGAEPFTARKLLAKAKIKPRTLVLYTGNKPHEIRAAEILEFNLQQIGIDLDIKYYDFFQMIEKAGTRGEPYDMVFNGWAIDYADPSAFLAPLLDPNLSAPDNFNLSYYSKPWVTARMDAADRLSGAARRNAWAKLDADLMRTDPPWAPITHLVSRHFISRSYGCYVNQPISGIDLTAACKK